MYSVLIADDEPIERMVVAKKMKQFFPEQIAVVFAENGREAVEKFEKEHCQVVILDISMPGMTGLEAAKLIREKSASCSIIFLTAYDDFNYAKKAIGVKALDYLLKPGNDEELYSVLEEAFSLIEAGGSKEDRREALEEKYDEEEFPENVKLNAVMEEIRSYMDQHYMEDISLQDVAAAMKYSDAYFCRLFKQCFDKNFIAYLNDLRLEHAIRLLKDATISIKDISERTGYRDANYFARVFKRHMGQTPSEYRLKNLK